VPNEEALEKVGEVLARRLRAGDLVLLYGELGVGKTTLTRGIARGLNVARRVVSPTFAIINEHPGDPGLFHFDLYRIVDPWQLMEIGFQEYRERNGVIVVEWPENLGELADEATHRIYLEYEEPGRRVKSADFPAIFSGNQ